jgi:hypothetical protein
MVEKTEEKPVIKIGYNTEGGKATNEDMAKLAAQRQQVIENAVDIGTHDPSLTVEQQTRKKKIASDRIMLVLKAVSAMRLTKEDKVPNCTLVRTSPPET